jgi:hypothetical protein
MALCFAPGNSLALMMHRIIDGAQSICPGRGSYTVRPLRHKDSYYGTRKKLQGF